MLQNLFPSQSEGLIEAVKELQIVVKRAFLQERKIKFKKQCYSFSLT